MQYNIYVLFLQLYINYCMKQGKGNYFFAPRIGEKYHEGFNGIRTLVVGAYHICYENCQFKDLCCDVDTIKEMDYKCPKYKDAPFYEKAELITKSCVCIIFS